MAVNKIVPDLIAPGLEVLFCGINPGLYSGATGHHFARPGNRFWPALHAAGFTPHRFSPDEEEALLELGYGITNIVDRTTAAAAELSAEELLEGGQRLEQKVALYKPKVLAVLGISAYRTAFKKPKAVMGLQTEKVAESYLWVLPNPSGLNAHYTPAALARVLEEFRLAVAEL